MIRAKNITKSYVKGHEVVEVLRGVDICVDSGKSVSIVGQSGTGKSTLLQILGTLQKPTSGELTFDGVDVLTMSSNALADFRLNTVGFVFQFHHLLPDFSAIENVSFPLQLKGESREMAFAKSAEILDRLGLSHRKHHLPNALSGGEQQRVAIARAVINSPKVLIADEPTGNLDAQTAKGVSQMLFELVKEQNIAFILATHHSQMAQQADHMVTLSNGIF